MAELQPDGWNPIEWSEWAMQAASKRLHEAPWHDVHHAYAALGETLWGVCQVDEMLRENAGPRYLATRKAEEAEGPIKALRYVRNRFAHDGEIIGFMEPGPGPEEYGDRGAWVWQPLPSASPGRAQAGEDEYQRLLVNRPVESTIEPALRFLRKHARDHADRWRGGTGLGVMVWTKRDETTGRTVVVGPPSLHPGFPYRPPPD